MRKNFFFLFLIFVGVFSFSQEIIDLQDALNEAFQNNHELVVEKYKIEEKENDLEIAKSESNISLDLKNTYMSSDEPGNVAFSKISQGNFNNTFMATMADPESISNFKSEFELMYPVYIGGKLKNGEILKKLELNKINLEFLRLKNKVSFDVTKSYYSIITSKSVLDVAKNSLALAKEHLKISDDMKNAGLAVKADVLRAEVFVSEMEEFVVNSQNNYQNAKYYLEFLLGRENNSDFIIEDILQVGSCEFDNVEEIIKLAFKHRKDLQAFSVQRKIVNKYMDINNGDRKPEIIAFAKYSTNSENDFFNGDGEGYSAGITLNYNIYDGKRVKSKNNKYQSILKQVDKGILALKRGISLEIRSKFLELKGAEKNITVNKKAAKQAKESLRMSQDRYKQGLAPFVSVIDAQTALKEADMQYIKSVHDFNVLRERLRFAAGMGCK